MFWRRSSLPYHLPLHDGRFVPGCLDLMTEFGPDGSFMRLWYPTSCKDVKEHAARWPRWMDNEDYTRGFSTVLGLWPVVMRLASTLISGDMHIPVVIAAEPIKRNVKPKLPVIVLSHGLGACRYFYSNLCCQLASYGFLVASVEHRDESSAATFFYANEEKLAAGKRTWLPFRVVVEMGGSHAVIRQRQLKIRAEECSRALDVLFEIDAGRAPRNLMDDVDGSSSQPLLDELKDRLELEKVSIMGHSFGAATALLTSGNDKRFKQLIALDSWLFGLKDNTQLPKELLNLPKIFINTQAFQLPNNLDVMRKYVQPSDSTFTIKATTHEHQCDTPLILGLWLNREIKRMEPLLAAQINFQLILRYLHQKTGEPKDWDNKKYLEEQSCHLVPAISIHETSKL